MLGKILKVDIETETIKLIKRTVDFENIKGTNSSKSAAALQVPLFDNRI